MAQMNVQQNTKIVPNNMQSNNMQTTVFSASNFASNHPIDLAKTEISLEVPTNLMDSDIKENGRLQGKKLNKKRTSEPSNIVYKNHQKNSYDLPNKKSNFKNNYDSHESAENHNNLNSETQPKFGKPDKKVNKNSNQKKQNIPVEYYDSKQDSQYVINNVDFMSKEVDINYQTNLSSQKYQTKTSVDQGDFQIHQSYRNNQPAVMEKDNSKSYETDPESANDEQQSEEQHSQSSESDINYMLYKHLRESENTYLLDFLENDEIISQFADIDQDNLNTLFDRLLDLMLENPTNSQICMLWIERYIKFGKIDTLEDAYQVYNIIAKMTGDTYTRIKKELKFIIEDLLQDTQKN